MSVDDRVHRMLGHVAINALLKVGTPGQVSTIRSLTIEAVKGNFDRCLRLCPICLGDGDDSFHETCKACDGDGEIDTTELAAERASIKKVLSQVDLLGVEMVERIHDVFNRSVKYE